MVFNIRKAKHGCRIYGSTGSKVEMNITTMRGVGRVIFDQDGPANVLSLAKMGNMYRITFDIWEGNTITVHKTNRSETKVGQHPCGLYYHDTATQDKPQSVNAMQRTINKIVAFLTTVAKNMKIFTHRQVERAKEARRASGMDGTPSPSDFKHMVRGQSIKYCPVTNEDIFVAYRIFGTDTHSLEGKTTRGK